MANNMHYSPEIKAPLIGCGAFCLSPANSSFFWLLNRMPEIPIATLYSTYTLQSLVMEIAGLLGILFLRLF